MNFLSETYWLTWRWYKHFIKAPFFVMFTIIQPIFWLVLFGNLFSGIRGNYINFLISSIIVMTVTGNSLTSGISLMFDRENKYLDRLLSSPISRWSIVASRFVFSNFLSVIQSGIIFFIAFLMGASLPLAIGIAQMLFIALFFGIGLVMISLSLSFVFEEHGNFFATIGFLNLPVIFLSSALLPLDSMSGFMKTAALLNPMTYAIEGSRSIMLGGGMPLSEVFAALLLFNVVCVLIASRSMKKL